jgi:hypothetical protein
MCTKIIPVLLLKLGDGKLVSYSDLDLREREHTNQEFEIGIGSIALSDALASSSLKCK